MGFFGESKARFYDPPEVAAARGWLTELLNRPVPQFPTGQIAPLSGLEEKGLGLAERFAGAAPGAERETAMGEALRVMTTPVDISKLPEFKPLVSEVMKSGNLMLNRMGRTLQGSGSLKSSPGARVLSRGVSDVAERLGATLAPYAESERGRRFASIPLVSDLADKAMNEAIQKINVAMQTGALPRGLEQAALEREFEQIMQTLMFPYTTQADVASRIFGAPQPQMYAESKPGFMDYWQAITGSPSLIPGGLGMLGGLGGGGAGAFGGSAGKYGGLTAANM